MCFTKGQWLQMNITSRPEASARSSRATDRPFVSGRRKSGAGVPSANIVEGVCAIRRFFLLRAIRSIPFAERRRRVGRERLQLSGVEVFFEAGDAAVFHRADHAGG